VKGRRSSPHRPNPGSTGPDRVPTSRDSRRGQTVQSPAKQQSLQDIPLPQDTRQVLSTGQGLCQNIGLLLERYIPWNMAADADSPSYKGTKPKLLDDLAKLSRQSDPLRHTLKAVCQRQEHLVKQYQLAGYAISCFAAKPAWRVVAGLGAASVLETSITLHPVYGFPIIPGSSLKGLARAYARHSKKVAQDRPDDEIDAVFGFQRGKTAATGKVVFFDAIPTRLALEPDIMNVHYQEYYEGKQPPADYLSPNPILFLTAGKDSEFSFALASPRGNDELLGKAEAWLKGGLAEMGVGAKTMVGYGYFDIPWPP